MSAYTRMQDLTSQNATVRQPVEEAIDVGAYKTVVVQVRLPKLATSGTLQFITSATKEETSYAVPGHWTAKTVNLTNAAGNENQTIVLDDPLRYLRWEISAISGGPVEFLIDTVAREV